jgi:hypothetical protein
MGTGAAVTMATARIALTSMAMKTAAGNAGFLSASAAKLTASLASMGQAAHSATVAYLRLAAAKSAADKQIANAGGVAVVRGGLGPIDSAIRKLEVWGLAAGRVGKSATVTSASVRGLFTVLGGTARILASALVGLSGFLVPIAAITGWNSWAAVQSPHKRPWPD